MRYLLRMFGVALMTSGLGSTALAQEVEPNNSCFSTQAGGTITPPAVVQGSIDAVNASPNTQTDVDFYTFSGTPGQRLTAQIGFEHLVGLFDTQCSRVDASSFNDPLFFEVPASGQFTIGVAERFDNSFSGRGDRNNGAYALAFVLQPPSVGSISGRLVDALSGEALLPRQSARVELRRCGSDGFCSFVTSQSTDALGRFRFELDSPRRRLPVGTYMVVGSATEYGNGSAQLAVAADENADFGDIGLTPPPVLFSEITPCDSLLPQGGVCQYSARIRNNTNAKLSGLVRSVVRGSSFSSSGPVLFEANAVTSNGDPRRLRVEIAPRSSSVVTFAINVPSFLDNGAEVCADLYLGVNPTPLFNTVRNQGLFCMRKGVNGLQLMNADEIQALFEREAQSQTVLQPPSQD